MIRSYVGYIEIIEMISRRLTNTQKAEIVEAFKAGYTTNVLAEKYSCTATTINRTVKTLLSDDEYIFLKEKTSKISNKKEKSQENELIKHSNGGLERTSDLIPFDKKGKGKGKGKGKEEVEDLSKKSNQTSFCSEVDKMNSLSNENSDAYNEDLPPNSEDNKPDCLDTTNKDFQNDFELISPLLSSFDFNQDKQKSDFEILTYESLPESVYMLVDKKVELDSQPISVLPEWSFLPENELKRNAILLFTNQRSAKRSCLRNQRVIKIPNTSIFKLSKSYLISKGITRLILEDSIIALDN